MATLQAVCCLALCVHLSRGPGHFASASKHPRADDTDLQSVMAVVQQQAEMIQQQESAIQTLQSQVAQLQQVENNHTADIAVINSRLDARVFFTAHMPGGYYTMSSDAAIRFSEVVTNMGGGYNPATGVFTAPVSGMYVLYAQLMKQGNTPTIHWAIDKSGTVLCMNSLDVPNDYDKSSCLATTHLQQGQQVMVRKVSDGATGTSLEGYWWCAFSGYLVSLDV